tara:strand:- start:1595 stop:1924 length:330 start_codon:yes stop_codon:yes gene_type:complete
MRKEKVKLIDSIIESINMSLERGDWTMEEVESGRIIEIKKGWGPVIGYISGEYQRQGWGVSRHAQLSSSSGLFHYLKFINPHYLHTPKEIRDTGVSRISRSSRRRIIIP